MLNPSEWFNPRRQLYAGRLLDYLALRGGKLFLTSGEYKDACAKTQLDRHAIDQAADDLYQIRRIKLSMAGEVQVLTLLSSDTTGARFRNGGRR